MNRSVVLIGFIFFLGLVVVGIIMSDRSTVCDLARIIANGKVKDVNPQEFSREHANGKCDGRDLVVIASESPNGVESLRFLADLGLSRNGEGARKALLSAIVWGDKRFVREMVSLGIDVNFEINGVSPSGLARELVDDDAKSEILGIIDEASRQAVGE